MMTVFEYFSLTVLHQSDVNDDSQGIFSAVASYNMYRL